MRYLVRRLDCFYLRHKQMIDAVGGVSFLLIFGYLGIGLLSLAHVAAGEDISCMPFWHAPWRWLLEFASK